MEKNKFRDMPRFCTIKEIVYHSVKLYPENIAFTIKQKFNREVSYRHITYRELLHNINALGTALHDMGLRAKRIAIIGKNQYEWALAHLSCMFGDMVCVPLDKDMQVHELQECLVRSKAEAIIFDKKHMPDILKIKEAGKSALATFICMHQVEDFPYIAELLERGKEMICMGKDNFADISPDADKMSMLLFTSGTTSNAKAVMLSQGAVAVNVYDMQIVESFYHTDVNIAFLPYHHIFGSTAIIVMLASGVKTVFPDGLKYIKQNLKEYQVSVFVGVPLLVDKIYATIEKEIARQGKSNLIKFAIGLSNFLLKLHIDLRRKLFRQIIDQLGGSLRMVIAGGAPLDKNVAERFREFGIHIVQGYGLTETAPVIAAENDFYVKAGSVGIPMRHMQVEISEPDDYGIGEIKVKGPNVMLGYYENEEATREVIKEGWFYTGDLGYFDEEGFLFITGRKKDMIVMKNGKKVFPEELETLINRNDEVEDSFVFGVPSRKDNIKVVAKIRCNDQEINTLYGDVSEDQINTIIWKKIDDINETLPMYKQIKQLILTKEPLIKTTTLKIKRHEELQKTLRQMQRSTIN